jgi:hypothetical protein
MLQKTGRFPSNAPNEKLIHTNFKHLAEWQRSPTEPVMLHFAAANPAAYSFGPNTPQDTKQDTKKGRPS